MEERFLRNEADKALDVMQSIQLQGLKEIDRICRKYDIKYSLGGGTCLGQVRHGGIIPWDDDIDVDMTLENYNKFVEVAQKELDPTRFWLQCKQTDPNHHRSSSRLHILGTTLSIPRFDKAGTPGHIFVDIFRWNYLPNDPKKRKKIASRLFFLHCMQDHKTYDVYAKKLDKKYHMKLHRLATITPYWLMDKIEDYYINYCKGEKTDWIIDDAIINGDHGGYPSEGCDEYEDVTFEGLTVMNKKNPHNFLRTLYGDKYNEWLPPTKRFSHHNWTRIDFGEFGEGHDLSEDYKEFLTTTHTYRKLAHMKKVSDMMVDKVAEICQKYGLHYKVEELSDEAANSFPEASEIWSGPVKILMLREDYDKFAEVCHEEFGKQYEYQAHITEPKYFFYYAKIRLNHTSLRDKKFPLRIGSEMNEGLFLKLIPLDDSPDNELGEKERSRARRWHRYLRLRWTVVSTIDFSRSKFKNKIKLIRLWRWTPEKLYNEVDNIARQFNGQGYDYCYAASGQMGRRLFKKEEILSDAPLKTALNGLDQFDNLDDFIEDFTWKYGACHLTLYNIPEWQVSSMRYDEKEDRFLTNEELIASS